MMVQVQDTGIDFTSSVVAVPPIALDDNYGIATEANHALVRHISEGGVSILLYGGNANLYHFGSERYAEALQMMRGAVATGAKVITSIGPDFGKALDQVGPIERSGLRHIMLLPTAFPADSEGVAAGVRAIADRLGLGIILYVKRENYIAPEALSRLLDEGAVTFVKYAVERADPEIDPYLDALIAAIGTARIASGMGETPILDHIGRRGLATFTSGAVCIAPRSAMRLLSLLKAGRIAEARDLAAPFLAFERVRSALGGIQVMHDAVSASVADMGPLMPMVSNVSASGMEQVRPVLEGLLATERNTRAVI